jgi:hypothetical protein
MSTSAKHQAHIVLPDALRDRIDALKEHLETRNSYIPLDRSKVIRILLDRACSEFEAEIAASGGEEA